MALPNYQTNLTFDGSNLITVLGEIGSNSAVQDMTIEMKVNDKTKDVDFSNILFNINFEKYELIEGDSTNGYYVSMGSNIVVDEYGVQSIIPVKWIPFAEYVGIGEMGLMKMVIYPLRIAKSHKLGTNITLFLKHSMVI